MSLKPPSRRDSDLLSSALKSIRRLRGMSKPEIAERMRMALRTYERFEAGSGRLNIDYIHRFAVATDSDPHAIIMAVASGSPDLARHCADNKMITTLIVGTQRFDEALGDRIQKLEARAVIAALSTMFETLQLHIESQARAEAWLERAKQDLSEKRPKPGR
jgi:transcriptional regulator with XRE-family HTH domain